MSDSPLLDDLVIVITPSVLYPLDDGFSQRTKTSNLAEPKTVGREA